MSGFLDKFTDLLIQAIYIIPVILISLTFHEFSHGFIAYRMGDYTAKNDGRLSLNPLAHLDPVGTIMLLISSFSGFGFGWAKPVPIDPSCFRKPKKGMVLTALAGPVSNFLLALVSGLIMVVTVGIIGVDDAVYALENGSMPVLLVFVKFMSTMISINLGLGIFNLLPIPPLDGAKIIGGFLPERLYFRIMEYETYIGLIFVAIILFAPSALDTVLNPCFEFGFDVLDKILTPVAQLFGSEVLESFPNVLTLFYFLANA